MDEHIPCRYSVPATYAFNNIEDKHILYPGEDEKVLYCSEITCYKCN